MSDAYLQLVGAPPYRVGALVKILALCQWMDARMVPYYNVTGLSGRFARHPSAQQVSIGCLMRVGLGFGEILAGSGKAF